VREADHSPPSSAEVLNTWSYTINPQYALMEWCSVKKTHGQLYLTFTFYLYIIFIGSHVSARSALMVVVDVTVVKDKPEETLL
jgi:hypothetical protein